ncbi:MAG: alcohol dehydrogenase [Gemmatimonadales bacterium]|nr:MAG: alcohol dehydrogenase [Gemmatimonadales bacterium]
MKALRFNVTVPGFTLARSLGRFTEAATFGVLSGLRLADVPVPELPGPDWVRLRTRMSGICGTDLATLQYRTSPLMEPFGSFPCVLGHEIVAEVEEVGEGAAAAWARAGFGGAHRSGERSRLEAGMRVAVDPMISCTTRGHRSHCHSCREGRHATCDVAGEEGTLELRGRELSPGLTLGYHRDLPGGWGSHLVAHASQLVPVPDALSDREAVLVEPLSIGMHAVLNTPLDPEEDILVIGSGPIAMGVIWALRATGFRGALVSQVKRSHEADLARAMGATDAVKPGLEAREVLVETGAMAYQPIIGDEVFSGGGFQTVFDCVGNGGSIAQSLRFTAPRGRVVLLGCASEIPGLDLTFLWARELEVKGFVGYGRESWGGKEAHTFEVTRDLMLETDAPLADLVTHVFPLAEYRDALSAAANHRRSGAVKVALTP